MSFEYVTGVVGRDNKNPIRELTSRFTIYRIGEIYLGGDADGKWIPKVLDMVVDPELGRSWRVDAVSSLGISTLTPVCFNRCDDEDALLAALPGFESENLFVHLDTNVYPHILAVDAGLFVGGSDTATAKIFLGVDSTNETRVISQMYDANHHLTGTSIPLETVAIDGMQNLALKCVPPAKTTTRMMDGEIVTVVFYNHAGHKVRSRSLRVVNTAVIRNMEVALRYVSDVVLSSPYIDPASPEVIRLPVNTPVASLNLMAVVHYSDGTLASPVPVDGQRVKLLGVDYLTAQIPGQPFAIALQYVLKEDEVSLSSTPSFTRVFMKPYDAVVIEPDRGYQVKLYPFPVWDGNSYQLRWNLLQRDGGQLWDVTDKVVYDLTYGDFKGRLYQTTQRLKVSLNLASVSASFKPHVHLQVVEIILKDSLIALPPPWEVNPVVGQALVQPIGPKLNGRIVNFINGIINLYNHETNIQTWLSNYYHKASPLLRFADEDDILLPNLLRIRYGGVDIEMALDNIAFNITLGVSVVSHSNVQVVFLHRDASVVTGLGVIEFVIE